jgi:predicted nucleic acid-binding protein
MRLLLDTNTLSYLLKGQKPVLERMERAARQGADFLLAPIVHFELTRYLSLKGAHRLERVYRELTASWPRLEVGFSDWEAAAQLWAERHRAGRAISDLDLLLSILARREQAVIVTSNLRHFEELGVGLEDWIAPEGGQPAPRP